MSYFQVNMFACLCKRVIRVPETESKGRLHSSTISVVVMPVVPMVNKKTLKIKNRLLINKNNK